MKLKNKKTGEIIEAIIVDHGAEWEIRNMYTDEHTQTYNSLAELNEEWEDCEEPKEHWYITIDGDVRVEPENQYGEPNSMKQIGNYFETEEQAEKAVEKLKAWKRLKDKGFDFEYVEGYKNLCGNGFEIPITATMPPEAYTDAEVSKDLDVCFGGEE